MGGWLDEMRALPHFRSLNGVSLDEIAECEAALGTVFAKDYREYLLSMGLCSVNGHEFTGVCGSQRLHVVPATLEARCEIANILGEWYVVERLGIDGWIAWQDSGGSVYLSREGQLPKKAASSLIEYARM